MSALVIRFSSLGDVVLASAVTPGLHAVVFVTHQRYAPLVERFQGVHSVVGLREDEGIRSLLARLPDTEWTVDLHGSLRSRILARRVGSPVSTVDKMALARRWRVAFKWPASIPTVIDRYGDAAGVEIAERPWIPIPRSENPDALVLVPGSAHALKQWPLFRYQAVADRWTGPLYAIGSLGEDPLLLRLWKATAGRVIPVAEDGFERTLEVLGQAAVVLGGDTGLIHLAAACGVPVVSLFGPTHSADGFWCHPGTVLEVDLACRPCGIHGGSVCPIGDHACLRQLSVGEVWSAVQAALAPNPVAASP
jgi:ADP-heptose:LPS heptosyltransferase